MEILRTPTDKKPQIEDHLPWHKPQIQRLLISLDTANAKGSGPDAVTHGPNFTVPTG